LENADWPFETSDDDSGTIATHWPLPFFRTRVNSLFVLLGIESWKPVLTALLLPSVAVSYLIARFMRADVTAAS